MNDERWNHLLHLASRYLESESRELTEKERLAIISQALTSALEVFSKDIDPNRDFQGYVVRRFLKALDKV